MYSYQIVTDSTTDLPAKLVEELGITVLPFTFFLEETSYLDDLLHPQISSSEFFHALRQGASCSTSQIPSARFVEAWEPILQAGRDILRLCFSSALSATYERACSAAEELRAKYPERTIRVVDTQCASLGEGYLVELCVEKQRAGSTLQEAGDWAEQARSHIAHWITVDDLGHLKRGGRISAASALVGSMLGIKPIIHVDDTGALCMAEKVRGRKASLDYIAEQISSTMAPGSYLRVVHGDALEDAKYVAEQIHKKTGVKEILIHPIGPVIGSHTGPGVVAAVAFCSKK